MHHRLVLIVMLSFFITAAAEEAAPIVWKNRIGLNTSLQQGNSSTLALSGDLSINRNNPWKNEWTLTANGRYQADHKTIINQSGETALRFAWSIDRNLYNFYRVSLLHNKISGIYRQILPTAGAGYWFSDTKIMQCLFEAGAGYNNITYYGDSASGEPVLQARFFAEYRFFENVALGNDSYFFPGRSRYLIKSSTYLTLKVKRLAAKFEFFADYNSHPVATLFKTDYQLKSGLAYYF